MERITDIMHGPQLRKLEGSKRYPIVTVEPLRFLLVERIGDRDCVAVNLLETL